MVLCKCKLEMLSSSSENKRVNIISLSTYYVTFTAQKKVITTINTIVIEIVNY